jgi:Gpi18-like mannosyltransferase
MRNKKSNLEIENPLMETQDPEEQPVGWKIREWFIRHDDLLFFIIMAVLAFWVRWAFIPFQSQDYTGAMSDWYNKLKVGGFAAFKNAFFTYPPAYLYLIWISTFLPVTPITAVKIIPFVFEFIAAIYTSLLVARKYKSNLVILLSFVTVLFLPTVILNGAVWGQCDALYTAALLATVYYLIKGKNWPAFIWFGIALSFKIQAIFLTPLLVFMFFKGKVKFYHFLIIPAVYIVTTLPCVFAGRPFWDLMLVFFRLTQEQPEMTMGFANFYQWIAQGDYEIFKNAGIGLAAAASTFLCYISYKSKHDLDEELIMRFSLLSLLLVPFFLPAMHERYYFPADLFSIALAFYLPRYYYVAITICMVSFFSYVENLFGAYVIVPKYLAIVITIVIIKLVYDYIKYLSLGDSENPAES